METLHKISRVVSDKGKAICEALKMGKAGRYYYRGGGGGGNAMGTLIKGAIALLIGTYFSIITFVNLNTTVSQKIADGNITGLSALAFQAVPYMVALVPLVMAAVVLYSMTKHV